MAKYGSKKPAPTATHHEKSTNKLCVIPSRCESMESTATQVYLDDLILGFGSQRLRWCKTKSSKTSINGWGYVAAIFFFFPKVNWLCIHPHFNKACLLKDWY